MKPQDNPRLAYGVLAKAYEELQAEVLTLKAQLAAAQPAIKAIEAIKVMGNIHIENWRGVWSAQVVDLDGDVLGNGDTPESAINNAYAIYPFQKRK